MTDELKPWEPEAFDGTDLLPIQRGDFGPSDIPVEKDDDVEADDIVLPTVAILQGTSGPVKDRFPGAAVGLLFLSGSQEVVDPPMRAIVIHRFRGNALFARAANPAHAGLETCISRDGVTGSKYGDCAACGKCTEWGDDGSKPRGTKTQQFVLWTDRGICILRVQLSGVKVARNISTFITKQHTSGRNWFAHPTVIQVQTDSKGDNSWPIPNLYWQEGERVPDDIQRECASWRTKIKEALEQGTLGDTEDAAPQETSERAAPPSDAGDTPF